MVCRAAAVPLVAGNTFIVLCNMRVHLVRLTDPVVGDLAEVEDQIWPRVWDSPGAYSADWNQDDDQAAPTSALLIGLRLPRPTINYTGRESSWPLAM